MASREPSVTATVEWYLSVERTFAGAISRSMREAYNDFTNGWSSGIGSSTPIISIENEKASLVDVGPVVYRYVFHEVVEDVEVLSTPNAHVSVDKTTTISTFNSYSFRNRALFRHCSFPPDSFK